MSFLQIWVLKTKSKHSQCYLHEQSYYGSEKPGNITAYSASLEPNKKEDPG